MADEEKILFSAEFEGDGLSGGVDESIKKLAELKEQQELNKQEIKDFNQAIRQNDSDIQKLQKTIDSFGKVTKANADTIKGLRSEMEALRQKGEVLNTNLSNSKKEYAANTVVIKEYTKAVNIQRKESEFANKAVRDFTSVNKLAGQAVNQLRGQVVTLATGIVSGFAGGLVAAAIPAITGMVAELFDLNKEMSDFELRQKVMGEINNKAAEGYAAQTTRLEIIRSKLSDLSIKESERIKLAKEYNKTAEESNKIDLQQINNIELVNEAITRQIAKIKERAFARAAEVVIAQKAEEVFKIQLQIDQKSPGFNIAGTLQKNLPILEKTLNDEINTVIKAREKVLGISGTRAEEILALTGLSDKQIQEGAKNSNKLKILLDEGTRDQLRSLNQRRQQLAGSFQAIPAELQTLFNNLNKAQRELDTAVKFGFDLIDVDDLLKPGKAKEIENVFAQKLAELQARLAAVTEKSFQSEGTIRKKFEAQLVKEFAAIEKLLEDEKLTDPQAKVLKGLLEQINDLELTKSLDEFKKKRLDAINAVNEAILDLQEQNAQKRIDNIRDELERERQAIEQGFDRSVKSLTDQAGKMIDKIDEEVKKGLLDPVKAGERKKLITLLFAGLIDQAEQAKTNKELDLAFKTFNKTVEESNNQFEELLVQQNEKTAQQIRDEKTKLAQGAINYETFQKNVTRILKEQKEARDKIRKAELEVELDMINKKLANTTDPGQQERLEERQRQIRNQIASIDSQVEKDPDDEREDALVKYAESVGKLLSTILNFWQQVNAAEEAALNRSIALQERRVENARDIAEKGNAEYLEQEQKRLDELERKREENARKQLAINNALTLSQATVAAITAISQAVQTGSPFAAIAALASVVGAIAAAYQFVNSLQPQEATFFEGTEYVEQGKNPPGKDTVPAKLNIGERVVTTKDNKDYWPTLTAIHNHLVPPEVVNSFVESYPNVEIPSIDYNKLGLATDIKIGADSFEVIDRLEKTNALLEEVSRGISGIGFNVNMDEEGFSASLEKFMRNKKLRSRA